MVHKTLNPNSRRVLCFNSFVNSLADLSKCTDKQNAAIVVNSDLDQVLSIGINGGAKGGIDCLCELPGKYTCIHAEANALIKCLDKSTDKIMFCTMFPCITCAAAICNSGFSYVFCNRIYHDTNGLKILMQANITVYLWNGLRYELYKGE